MSLIQGIDKNGAGGQCALVVVAVKGDKKAAAEQFATTGKEGCGGCHTTFRIPKT